MYRLDEIRDLQLEARATCHIGCPMCIRYTATGKPLPVLASIDPMTQVEFEAICPPSFLKQLTRVGFCGNYGDPTMWMGLPGLWRYIRKHTQANIEMETHGAVKTPAWWTELAQTVVGTPHRVAFNIDGLEDTLTMYRKHSDYAAVLANAQAFIKAGGQALWGFLVFKHNEHQVEMAAQRAADLGFQFFEARKSDRFWTNQGQHVEIYRGIKEAQRDRYKYHPPKGFPAKLMTTPIVCQSLEKQQIFLDAQGRVFPCCFTAAVHADDPEDRLGMARIKELLDEVGWDTIDTTQHTLSECLESPFFTKLQASWTTPQRPVVCAAVCGIGHYKLRQE